VAAKNKLSDLEYAEYPVIVSAADILKLQQANAALVGALDLIHGILTGDDYLEHPDTAIEEIINEAIRLHKVSTPKP